MLSLCVPASRACSCTAAAPGKCAGLQKDDVVFLGTVTGIDRLAAENPETASLNSNSVKGPAGLTASSNAGVAAAPAGFQVTRYRFRVDEKFSGADTAEMEVYSGGDDGDCGYNFQKGSQYIVFTQQETEGRLFATVCNGTRPANEGRALLPQLRAMRSGQHVASVFGILRRSDPPFLAAGGDSDDPLPRVGLKLRSRVRPVSDDHGCGRRLFFLRRTRRRICIQRESSHSNGPDAEISGGRLTAFHDTE